MTTARSAIVPRGSPGYCHCVSRCVRKSFLCGVEQTAPRRARFVQGGWRSQEQVHETSGLDRLGLTDRSWTTQVKATESDFYRVIGAAESIIDYAKRAGQHWLQGLGVARELCKMRTK